MQLMVLGTGALTAGTSGTIRAISAEIAATCGGMNKSAGQTFATCERTGEKASPGLSCEAIGETSGLIHATSGTTVAILETIVAIVAQTTAIFATIDTAASFTLRFCRN